MNTSGYIYPVTTEWTYHTRTMQIPSSPTYDHSLAEIWGTPPDWSSGDWFEVAQVQLELGKVATPFEHRSYGEELALCQRYYYKHAENTSNYVGVGWVYSSTSVYLHIDFPVTMRATPSAVYSNTSGAYTFYITGTSNSISTFSAGNGTDTGMTLINSTTVSGFGPGQAGGWYAPSGLIAFNAEL